MVAFATYAYPWKLDLLAGLRRCGADTTLLYFDDKTAYGIYEFMTEPQEAGTIRLPSMKLLAGTILPRPQALQTLLRLTKGRVFLDIDSHHDIVQICLSLLHKLLNSTIVRIVAENRAIRVKGNPCLLPLWAAKRMLTRLSLRFSDLVLAESRASADFALRMGVQSRRIVQICHGVNLRYFAGEPADSQGQSKLADAKLTVLYLGGFVAHKGVEYLVRAIETGQLSSLDFLLLAAGPELPRYVPRLARLKSVKLVEPVPHYEMRELYSAAHIVIVPSITTETDCERSPNVIIEAMAMGKAVVASSIGGIPDILGDAGMYIEQRNELEIVSALKHLDENRNELLELVRKGRQRASDMFDDQRYAETVFALVSAFRENPRSSSSPRHQFGEDLRCA